MNDIGLINNIRLLYDKKIILYGAGRICEQFCEQIKDMNLSIAAVCDRKWELWGGNIMGIPVIAPERLSDYENFIVIITSRYIDEIHKKLTDELQVDSKNIFTMFGFRYSVMLNRKSDVFPEKFRQDYNRQYDMWIEWKRMQADFRFTYKYYQQKWSDVWSANPIMVFNAGKVGSISVYNSMLRYNIAARQTHALAYRPEYMDESIKKFYDEFKRKIAGYERVRVISGVREPISRDISHIFENIYFPFAKLYENFTPDFYESVNQCLCDNFIREISYWGESPTSIHQYIRMGGKRGGEFEWFNTEIKEVYGIDVYDYPFDRENGYTIIKQGNVELFLYKLEKLDSLEEALGQFIGLENFKLSRENTAEIKSYKYAYEQLRREIVLREEYVNAYYQGNKYMDHFYTENEKNSFMQKYRVKRI